MSMSVKRYVGFYDLASDSILAVEQTFMSYDEITYTSLLLTDKYSSGAHTMPSSIWVYFDEFDKLRVFFLTSVFVIETRFLLDRISDAVIDYLESRKPVKSLSSEISKFLH